MQYKIYQLKDMRGCDYGFMDWEYAKSHGFTLGDYKEVYSGEEEKQNILERLFEKFNINHPEDFRGHSLSVSDVVALKDPEKDYWYWYYCDDFGWTEISDVVNVDDDQKYDKKMNELLWNLLKDHWGHHVEIAVYGDPDAPASVTLEDMNTGTVILDAGIYTICGREDV